MDSKKFPKTKLPDGRQNPEWYKQYSESVRNGSHVPTPVTEKTCGCGVVFMGRKDSCENCSRKEKRKTSPYFCDTKEGRRLQILRSKYGLTEEKFKAMVDLQQNRCAICRKEFTDTPHVDHNHETNEVRGLLCPRCNTAIGLLEENESLFKNAVDYLHCKRIPNVPICGVCGSWYRKSAEQCYIDHSKDWLTYKSELQTLGICQK